MLEHTSAASLVARCIRITQRPVVVERMLRRRQARRQRPLRDGLEIRDTRVAPPLGLRLLDPQERRDLVATLGVHLRPDIIPGLAHLADDLHSMRVAIYELVPKCAARTHPMAPGDMVKPQQIVLRHAPQVAEFCSYGRGVLRNGVSAAHAAIEADPLRVRAMKVHGRPVRSFPTIEPRLRTVMMTLGHQVVQAEWRHVVHDRLARLHHHVDDARHEGRIVRKRHAYPIARDAVSYTHLTLPTSDLV